MIIASGLKSKFSNPCRQRQLRTRDESANDRKRTILIAFSCISLVIAGLFSRASFAEGETVSAAKTIRVGAKIEAASAEARFARAELIRYRKLARELKSREAEEADGPLKLKMEAAIDVLESAVKEAQSAVEEFETTSGRRDFRHENLKGSLFALQDAGQNAVSTFVDVDNASNEDSELVARYVFKDNRTGQ